MEKQRFFFSSLLFQTILCLSWALLVSPTQPPSQAPLQPPSHPLPVMGLVRHALDRNLKMYKGSKGKIFGGGDKTVRQPLETLIKVLRKPCDKGKNCGKDRSLGELGEAVSVSTYGNDNFTTITEAVAAATNHRKGVYEECIVISNFKRNMMLAFILGFCFLVLTMKRKKPALMTSQTRNLPLPPGPKSWPLIGNLQKLLQRKRPVFRWIHSLMKELNTEIACIRLANTHVIPVTSPRIAREILKKQDSIFATRPLTMGTEYSSRGYLTIAVEPQGEQWKKMRRVVASYVTSQKSFKWMLDKRTEEADNLVRYINNLCIKSSGNGINLRVAVRQYSGNVVRKMIFGVRHFGKGSEDRFGPGLEEIEHIESLFTVLTHLYAFALSDYVPWLRFLDLEGHEKVVSQAMKIVSKYNDSFVDERLMQWRNGKMKEPRDFLDMFILAKHSDGKAILSDEEIKAQVTELMLATVDNPANAAEWAMAEMINEPSIMQKALEEIDRVVGKDRLVLESDLPKLNYVKACVKESFRLHPVAPFNLPHMSTSNTVVDGYFIPKGSHVLISRMGIGRNPNVWDKPLKFDPERHLGSEIDVELNEPDLNLVSFSTGRRSCMGKNIGSAMTYMLLARLIQGFTWSVFGECKIDISEGESDLFMAKPLHAVATPRLAPQLYLPT